MKQTKNVLTRDMIRNELQHITKASVKVNIVFLISMSVICVPFILLGIAGMSDSIVFGTLLVLILVTPLAFLTKMLIDSIIEKNMVEKGEFYIIKDTVSRLSRGEPAGRYRTVDVLYFTKLGRHVPSKTVFDLSSVGDEFYLVLIAKRKLQITFAYHTMMYECNDVDDVEL